MGDFWYWGWPVRLAPWGAVDMLGNIYVADSGNNRIQKFDSNGAFLVKWGSFGTGDGQFDTPCDDTLLAKLYTPIKV